MHVTISRMTTGSVLTWIVLMITRVCMHFMLTHTVFRWTADSQADKEDESVDFVWYSAGIINDDGYRVEIQIPLKSIRFSKKEPVEMSVFFERKISREAMQGSYPAMDPAKGMAFLTQMKPMIYNNVRHYKLFEVLPAFTYTHRDVHTAGEMQERFKVS